MSIHKLYGIFNQIETHGAKTVKEQILKNNEGDMEFREALCFLLNPYIVTGISTKKMNKKIKDGLQVKGFIMDFKHLMEHLKTNNSGRDGDILMIQNFINNQETPELQEFIKKFVTKDLKLGISEKTVNKVYGKGTIPSFAVMLAESFEKKVDKVAGKFYVTLKIDGNRCVAIRDADGVKFFSRKGRAIEGMTELEEQFNNLLPIGHVYDGELLLVNKDNVASDVLFRATQKVVKKDGIKKDLDFHIFDFLTIHDFQNGKSKTTYTQRRNQMDMLETHVESCENIHILPVLYEGDDKSVIPAILQVVEENGFEGLMVNTADGLYQDKRTVDLLKVKTMKSADLLVMSVVKAIDGEFKGLMRRVNVEYKGNLVGCGSGFSLEQRKLFIDNPDLICGTIIEVQHFGESKDDKTGLPSLRFPIFKGIRDDKTVEDINYGE